MTDEFRHVRVEDLPDAPNPTRHKKEVDEAVGATEFGFNVVTADPGQQLPWGFHSHPDHEELFYVLSGTVEFETREPQGGSDGRTGSEREGATRETEDRTYEVTAGEAFFVPRDRGQRGVAVGDEPARVVAVGAPKATDDAVIEEACPSCGAVTGRAFDSEQVDETTVYVLSCAECGTETDRLTPGPS